MNNGTDINQLMKDGTNNKLTNEENSMVDSIISDLNPGEKAVPQQQKMPQITDEERNMLIKQEQHERQMMMERQEMVHRQQQIQQQQMNQRKQMADLQQQQQKLNEIKEESIIDKMKGLLYDNKEVFKGTEFLKSSEIGSIIQSKVLNKEEIQTEQKSKLEI